MEITAENVESVFASPVLKHEPHDKLSKQVTRDFIAIAQSILYNVPASERRGDILGFLLDMKIDCVKLIMEG